MARTEQSPAWMHTEPVPEPRFDFSATLQDREAADLAEMYGPRLAVLSQMPLYFASTAAPARAGGLSL